MLRKLRGASSDVRLLALSLQLLAGVPRAAPATMLHTKARQDYQGGIKRFPVPDDKVPWSVDYPEYQPVDYSAPVLYEKRPWADPDIKWVGQEHGLAKSTHPHILFAVITTFGLLLHTCTTRF